MRVLRLKRDASLWEQLSHALDTIGVENGEEFVVAARASYTPRDDVRDNSAVRGKADASREAAVRVWPTTGSKRWRVIAALADGPLTRKQIIAKSGVVPNTARPRVLEAIDGGWVRQSQATPFVDGNEVLELTEQGRAALQSELAEDRLFAPEML